LAIKLDLDERIFKGEYEKLSTTKILRWEDRRENCKNSM